MQVLLGGGVNGNGEGALANKVIKLPAKRVPEGVRVLLNDYKTNSEDAEKFNEYYQRKGKNYFYNLLKPVSEITKITQEDLLDWGANEQYQTMIGIGECAGSLIDMVAIALDETREKILKAEESFRQGEWVDCIYYSYSSYINAARL
jgi:sulfite reductase (ferredoxin)